MLRSLWPLSHPIVSPLIAITGPLLLAACAGGGGAESESETITASGTQTTTEGPTTTTENESTTTGDPTGGMTDSATGTTTAGTTEPTTTTQTTTETETETETTGEPPCGGCPGNFKCKYDTCIPDLGECETYDDCPGDSYCDDDGECIPYGVPPDKVNDPNCTKEDIPEGVIPAVQCEWTGVGDNSDPTNGSNRIYTTPSVADLNLDKDPDKLQPSVIVTTWETVGNQGRLGTLRVFDGRTCTEQLRAGGADIKDDANRPAYAVTWAVGDLDNDLEQGGHPELVSYRRQSSGGSSAPVSLYAMRIVWDGEEAGLERMWYGRDCETDTILTFGHQSMEIGPMLIDLDDDDFPEILAGENVFRGYDGCLLSSWDPARANVMAVVEDVDFDGIPDLVTERRFASWDKDANDWVDKPGFVPDNNNYQQVHLGLANFGLYSVYGQTPIEDLPELAVLTVTGNFGTLRLQKLTGGPPVWGPMPLYSTGNPSANRGGPITISDFDGDGQAEFASAGATHYTVYDPDCVAALGGASPPERPGGKCERSPEQEAKNLPDGVLWVQPSRDLSSNRTGSSIFDFNGDGAAEAVYRDECFLRVYDGKSGDVIFSGPASNGTGMEYPSIADVDGDFATEIIVPRTPFSNCPAQDPLFPDGETFVSKGGFVIYRDPEDRWANSRPVWNQHQYSVTHVEDNAKVTRLSSQARNWMVEGLNNLRQNTQGNTGLLQIADLTVELQDLGAICGFEGGTKELVAKVCNRGTNPVVDGVVVRFLESMNVNQKIDEATMVCETATTKLLKPDDCELVSCTAELVGDGNIFVHVDPEGLIADCHPGNNIGADALGLCPE